MPERGVIKEMTIVIVLRKERKRLFMRTRYNKKIMRTIIAVLTDQENIRMI